MASQSATTLPPEGVDPRVQEHTLWTETALRLGFADFLSPADDFRSCTNTGELWANRAHPGIYFWLCENGQAYLGQSI